jgi:dolichyl-diphosphooligosaccharide--protein glycosyltransferase
MLTLTPVVCVLAAIAFSKVFSIYLRDDNRRTESADESEEDKEKNDKYYDKVCSS